jgi:hypothetical protein
MHPSPLQRVQLGGRAPMLNLGLKQTAALRKRPMGTALVRTLAQSGMASSREPASGDMLPRAPCGGATRFGFDSSGFIGSVTSPLERKWILENDDEGRLVSPTDPAACRLSIQFEPDSNLGSVAHNSRRLFDAMYKGGARFVELSYDDATKRTISVVDRPGSKECYEYGSSGRMTRLQMQALYASILRCWSFRETAHRC